MKNCTYPFIVAAITGCAVPTKRMVDQSAESKRPNWVESTKITWNEGDQVLFRSQFTIRGDERVNGCYQLAKLDLKEGLLREISEDIRGQIDNAQQSISESAELILTQSRSSEYGGKVTGMRALEQYHERYSIDGTERVDCFVLGSIRKFDYDNVRRAVVHKLTGVDPSLRKVLTDRQNEFFKPAKKTEAMAPAQAPTPVAATAAPVSAPTKPVEEVVTAPTLPQKPIEVARETEGE